MCYHMWVFIYYNDTYLYAIERKGVYKWVKTDTNGEWSRRVVWVYECVWKWSTCTYFILANHLKASSPRCSFSLMVHELWFWNEKSIIPLCSLLFSSTQQHTNTSSSVYEMRLLFAFPLQYLFCFYFLHSKQENKSIFVPTKWYFCALICTEESVFWLLQRIWSKLKAIYLQRVCGRWNS